MVNRLVLLTEMILCIDKLGKRDFIEFSRILINCGFYANRRNSGLALYLKMLVLVTTIRVPNFMLVSRSADSPEILSYAAGLWHDHGISVVES